MESLPRLKLFKNTIHLLVFSLKYENIREANLSFFVLNAALAKNTNSAVSPEQNPNFFPKQS
jgi:hypothetical protein